jgi:hypothetical protein
MERMPTTATPGSVAGETAAAEAPKQSQRPGWVIPVVVVVVLAVIGGIVLAVMASGEDVAAPEEVVTEAIDAANARDVERLEAVYHPDVVVTFDGTAVGVAAGGIPATEGREAMIEGATGFWAEMDPTVTFAVISVDGQVVTTDETATMPDGMFTRHEVTYDVSEDGLIVTEHHVILE